MYPCTHSCLEAEKKKTIPAHPAAAAFWQKKRLMRLGPFRHAKCLPVNPFQCPEYIIILPNEIHYAQALGALKRA